MKKIIFLLLITSITLLASNANPIKIKILEKVINNITIQEDMSIWSDNDEILSALKDSKSINVVDKCSQANILILDKAQMLNENCFKKYIFVLNYNLLTDIPQSFGALFWKKGRPNIVIIEPRINNQKIKVTNNLLPYLEEKVW